MCVFMYLYTTHACTENSNQDPTASADACLA